MAMSRTRVPARSYVTIDWPREARERLQAYLPSLEALADACGQPRGSIVLADGSVPVRAVATTPAAETKPVTAMQLCTSPRPTTGEIRRIEDALIAAFGNPYHDKEYHRTWDVPADWTTAEVIARSQQAAVDHAVKTGVIERMPGARLRPKVT